MRSEGPGQVASYESDVWVLSRHFAIHYYRGIWFNQSPAPNLNLAHGEYARNPRFQHLRTAGQRPADATSWVVFNQAAQRCGCALAIWSRIRMAMASGELLGIYNLRSRSPSRRGAGGTAEPSVLSRVDSVARAYGFAKLKS